MFTGLIEEVGSLRSVKKQGEAMVLTIAAQHVVHDVKIGDSIAVNGVCLTVTAFTTNSFTADVMPQTYRKSNLHELQPGAALNLERAMQVGARFGGHIVQGHVDGTGTIVGRTQQSNATVFTIQPRDEAIMRAIMPQGSITIDGISLTVASAEEGTFTVWIIPHTLKQTALETKASGQVVNLENDVIAKYVDHLLSKREPSNPSKLSVSWLAEHGFY